MAAFGAFHVDFLGLLQRAEQPFPLMAPPLQLLASPSQAVTRLHLQLAMTELADRRFQGHPHLLVEATACSVESMHPLRPRACYSTCRLLSPLPSALSEEDPSRSESHRLRVEQPPCGHCRTCGLARDCTAPSTARRPLADGSFSKVEGAWRGQIDLAP